LDPDRVKSTQSDGDGVGALRHIVLADGSLIIERIEWKDLNSRRLVYSIVGESVLPVNEYLAIAKVTEIDSHSCQLDWQSTFSPLGSIEHAQETVKALYNGGAIRIRTLLE
jgi:hypothetical protein